MRQVQDERILAGGERKKETQREKCSGAGGDCLERTYWIKRQGHGKLYHRCSNATTLHKTIYISHIRSERLNANLGKEGE